MPGPEAGRIGWEITVTLRKTPLRGHHFNHRFPPPNRLRGKSNFVHLFKPNLPVQISRKKYSAWRFPQISRIFLRIPPRAEGRNAIVTEREAGSDGREGSQHSLWMRTNDHLADGEAVWF